MLIEGTGTLLNLLQIPQGNQKVKIVHVHRHVGLHIHNGQIHGPQAQLGQDTGKNGRDAALGMEKARSEACQHTGTGGCHHSQPYRIAGGDHHGTDRTTGAEGAVHRQVGHIQYFIGNVHANGHDAPDQTLGHRTGQGVKETCHRKNPPKW